MRIHFSKLVGLPESVKGWSQPAECRCHLGNHAVVFFVEECHEVGEADAVAACRDTDVVKEFREGVGAE
jgi:hypothetical protein